MSDRVHPIFLDLDGAFDGQKKLVAEGMDAGGEWVAAQDLGPPLRLWSRPMPLEVLRKRMRAATKDGPSLVFAGSGDFHHVTPMLVQRAIERSNAGPVTIVHFDNHPDWVRFENGLHCGSWVGRAARLVGVSHVITVGVCSRDIISPKPKKTHLDLVRSGRLELYAYRSPLGRPTVNICDVEQPTIETLGESVFADLLISRIKTDSVYITIDKDVLRPEDAITNWDQGGMSLSFMASLIQRILVKHRLIGADIVGDWSVPHYGGGIVASLFKRGEAMLDQPQRRPDCDVSDRLNEDVNRQLLRLFVAMDL